MQQHDYFNYYVIYVKVISNGIHDFSLYSEPSLNINCDKTSDAYDSNMAIIPLIITLQ